MFHINIACAQSKKTKNIRISPIKRYTNRVTLIRFKFNNDRNTI